MRFFFIAVLALLVVVSCNTTNRAPEFVTFKTIPHSEVHPQSKEDFLNENHAGAVEGKYPLLDSLIVLQNLYFAEKEKYSLTQYRQYWEAFREETGSRKLSEDEIYTWIDLTGFLFQLTADATVAEELQRIARHELFRENSMLRDSMIMPYALTRHTDNVHVNLFLPASISFEHSLGGKVSISQKSNFPESGEIKIVFGMETKQYIELYVRIPSWANNAAITVKGVKYLTQPGSYTKIAKKWKEGDEVEISIPMIHVPPYLTPER